MRQADRVIYHADMNAYFASVEELFRPELREVPMAVCGDPESRRGIIVAKNQKAKERGVKTAETIHQALKKCPGLVLCKARYHAYDVYCEKANAIYGQYTDLVEPASIDESYLDVTESLHLFGGDPEALAHTLRLRVQAELGLTISVGVSFNKFFAKMGSEMKKPNAVTVLSRENFREKLWPLPIGQMHMVGKATAAALGAVNIGTIGDLARADRSLLSALLGKQGEGLHQWANGEDASPVIPVEQAGAAKSIGKHSTFSRDLVTREEVKTGVAALADTVATALRREKVKCLAVQLTIKDAAFAVITRQKGLPAASWLSAELAAACMELFDACWSKGKPVRLLAVTAMKLMGDGEKPGQVTLFETPALSGRRDGGKLESLERTLDKIREKYGAASILTADVAFSDIGLHDRRAEAEKG